jgi:hypothetical protein
MSFQPMGLMWLYDNYRRADRGTGWKVGVFWSSLVIILGTFIMIAGTYGSIVGIINDKNRTDPWSCADNSNSAAK